MGMGEFAVCGPLKGAGSGPARGRDSYGAAWSDPVKSVINRLWTTLVDKWSLSVRQVHGDGRQLNIGTFFRPSSPRPMGPSGIDRVCESSAGEPYEPALAWTSDRRGGRRSGLPGFPAGRHARCHDAEMTFERAELGRGAEGDDGDGVTGGGWVCTVGGTAGGSAGGAVGGTAWFWPPRPPDARGVNRSPGAPVKQSGERPYFERCRARGFATRR